MSVATKKTAPKRSPFGRYRAYLRRLQVLLNPTELDGLDEKVEKALNGEASQELRNSIGVYTRRKFGAFFTGSVLSKKLLAICEAFDGHNFHDPTCGMGDLLLAAARRLPLEKTLLDTACAWGDRLSGTDLHSEFIDGTKMRLFLLARERHNFWHPLNKSPADFFPRIRVADGLQETGKFSEKTILLMNPPFVLMRGTDCSWAKGRVSKAAMFVDFYLKLLQPGGQILAILPEVLRAGSFSEQWRRQISKSGEVRFVETYGIFDESADVDVFMLHLIRRHLDRPTSLYKWPDTTVPTTGTLMDSFDVHVGRVVPHRDPETGPEYPYIHPRCMPMWEVMRRFPETRRHPGAAYKAPFVAIRRTSRPGHPYRAAATVIGGKSSVAVENHVIVCLPKDGLLTTCKDLMSQLKTKKVNEFLDQRIRCRHLTVGAVEAIPFRHADGPEKQ